MNRQIKFIEDYVMGFSNCEIHMPKLDEAKSILEAHYLFEIQTVCAHSFIESARVIWKCENLGLNTDDMIILHNHEQEKLYHEVKEDIIRLKLEV